MFGSLGETTVRDIFEAGRGSISAPSPHKQPESARVPASGRPFEPARVTT